MNEERRIDRKQVQLIHIAKSQLGLSEEKYREIISERYWQRSSKDLSYKEASDLIDYFKTMGFKVVAKGRTAAGTEGKRRAPYDWRWKKEQKAPLIVKLPASGQIAKIEALTKDVRWHMNDGFKRWLQKYLARDLEAGKHWRSLIHTSKEAQYVIEALKGMVRRQEKIAEAKARQRDEEEKYFHDAALHGGYIEW